MRIVVPTFLGLFLAFHPKASGWQTDELDGFLYTYERSLKVWQERFKEFHGTGTCEISISQDGKHSNQRIEFNVFYDGKRKATQVQKHEKGGLDWDRVYMFGEDSGFFLEKLRNAQLYAVTNFHLGDNQAEKIGQSFITSGFFDKFLLAAFQVAPGESLPEIASAGRITSVRETIADQGPAVEVSIEVNTGNYSQLTVLLLKDYDLAVEKARIDFKRGPDIKEEWVETKVNYDLSSKSFAVPSRISRRSVTTGFDGKGVNRLEEIEIREIEFGKPEPEVFTLAHYGLPDFIADAKWRKKLRKISLFAFAVVLVASSWWIVKLRRNASQ